jgi:isoleucyl-tRNA synthetase
VTIYADGALRENLERLGEELRFVFITSDALVAPLTDAPTAAIDGQGFKATVGSSQHDKCVRCWHRRADVGDSAEHPEICGRCIANVDGVGEQRAYA